jgi:hypothetical protein
MEAIVVGVLRIGLFLELHYSICLSISGNSETRKLRRLGWLLAFAVDIFE